MDSTANTNWRNPSAKTWNGLLGMRNDQPYKVIGAAGRRPACYHRSKPKRANWEEFRNSEGAPCSGDRFRNKGRESLMSHRVLGHRNGSSAA
jgi:hypothetical protein